MYLLQFGSFYLKNSRKINVFPLMACKNPNSSSILFIVFIYIFVIRPEFTILTFFFKLYFKWNIYCFTADFLNFSFKIESLAKFSSLLLYCYSGCSIVIFEYFRIFLILAYEVPHKLFAKRTNIFRKDFKFLY